MKLILKAFLSQQDKDNNKNIAFEATTDIEGNITIIYDLHDMYSEKFAELVDGSLVIKYSRREDFPKNTIILESVPTRLYKSIGNNAFERINNLLKFKDSSIVFSYFIVEYTKNEGHDQHEIL